MPISPNHSADTPCSTSSHPSVTTVFWIAPRAKRTEVTSMATLAATAALIPATAASASGQWWSAASAVTNAASTPSPACAKLKTLVVR